MNSYPQFAALLNQLLRASDRPAAWLANRLGVSPSTVNRWLNGQTRPGRPEVVIHLADILGVHDAAERQALLAAVGYGYQAAGKEAAPSVRIDRADKNRSAAPQPGSSDRQTIDLTEADHRERPKKNWGEAPDVTSFYGREAEIARLEAWLLRDRCRLVGVLGIGGIGKTALVTRLALQVQDQFEYLVWSSLRNAPSLEEMLADWILLLSDQQHYDLPVNVDQRLSILLDYLRRQRCLLILDNAEAVLQAGGQAGHFRVGYEAYGRLLQRIGEGSHQSCLVLTSREKPREVALLEGERSPVRSLRLAKIDPAAGQAMLADRGLTGSEVGWSALIERYSGNPLALKLVAETIRELFSGDIATFLEDKGASYGAAIFGSARELLGQQFARLSELEQELLVWLAIEREAISADQLHDNMVRPVSRRALLESLRALRRRSLLETSEAGYTLQNVVMEFLTDYLVEVIYHEIQDSTAPIQSLNRVLP